MRISTERTGKKELTIHVTIVAVGSDRQLAGALRLVGRRYEDIQTVGTIGAESFNDGVPEGSRYVFDNTDMLVQGNNGEAVINLFIDAHWAMTFDAYVEYGLFTRKKYNVSTYKWCNGSIISMTKYNTDINYGIVDDKTELDPADDAATVNWGSEWCMPTAEEIEELYNLDYVTSEWSIQNGVKGRLITSKKNGNSIFLPVAGYRLDLSNGSLYEAGSNGYYWTNSCRTNSACILNFGMTAVGEMQYFNRAQGCSVRPVRVEKAVVSSIDDVTANQKATKSGKYISDGNLVIVKDGKLYNANGTKVK